MFKATLRTLTELLDSKKAAYTYTAVIFASVLHLYFGVSVESALLLISPLGLATAAQAHVDAAAAKRSTSSSSASSSTGAGSAPAVSVAVAVPAPAPAPAAPPAEGTPAVPPA